MEAAQGKPHCHSQCPFTQLAGGESCIMRHCQELGRHCMLQCEALPGVAQKVHAAQAWHAHQFGGLWLPGLLPSSLLLLLVRSSTGHVATVLALSAEPVIWRCKYSHCRQALPRNQSAAWHDLSLLSSSGLSCGFSKAEAAPQTSSAALPVMSLQAGFNILVPLIASMHLSNAVVDLSSSELGICMLEVSGDLRVLVPLTRSNQDSSGFRRILSQRV